MSGNLTLRMALWRNCLDVRLRAAVNRVIWNGRYEVGRSAEVDEVGGLVCRELKGASDCGG